ncbi:MAG: PEP-CTERM sorting domain-containing protein [Gemmatimonadaceae bacterium]
MSISSLLPRVRRRTSAIVAGCSLLALAGSASTASAQAPVAGNFQWKNNGTSGLTLATKAVGPYRADMTGFTGAFTDRTNAPVWCIDFAHNTGTTVDTYYATALSGTDFTKTLNGSKLTYQKAAWLIEQYDAGVANFTATNVQGTLWELFNPGNITGGYTNLLSTVPGTITLTKTWFVMSDKIDGTEITNQEFLYSSTVTPEPSTYLLMATGLGAVGFMARRRRRNSIATA